MADGRTWLVVGLGNPGNRYRNTRHNVGFMTIESLAATWGILLAEEKFQARFGRGKIAGIAAILAEPLGYMNRSGPPVRQLADYFRITSDSLLVVHDDIDLAFGRLKLKEKGGHGGHNGVRSLMEAFGGGNFVRLRIGIGRSATDGSVTDHVLGRYRKEERKLLDPILDSAREAVAVVLTEGLAVAMNRFNDRRGVVGS
jgi:PTH1 family peptidyl-tRNA hydrolase